MRAKATKPTKATKPARRAYDMGDQKWVDRSSTLVAIKELQRALEEGRRVDPYHGHRLLECITAWLKAGGKITLDHAFGIPVRGWQHPLTEYGLMVRNNAYLLEVAHLVGLGLSRDDAAAAIAGRWPRPKAEAARRPPPPWVSEHPTIGALTESSLMSEILDEHFKTDQFIIDHEGLPSTIGERIAAAKAWSQDERRAYLAQYPQGALPPHFI